MTNRRGPGRKPFNDRFWNKCTKTDTDCWEWSGSKSADGYGQLTISGRRVSVTRLSYELTYGPFEPTLQVLHKCDNPPCFNPSHLFLGTQKDNVQDCISKNRSMTIARAVAQPRGTAVHTAKLTPTQVIGIRGLYTGTRGEIASLARHFNVSEPTIKDIVSRKSWKHVG